MKKKIIIILVILVLLLTIAGLYFALGKKQNKEIVYISYESKYIENFEDKNKIITSFSEYEDLLTKYGLEKKLTEKDFNTNNYIILFLEIDECSEKIDKIKNLEITKEAVEVNITYNSTCGVCAPVIKIYLIKIDKDLSKDAEIKTNYILKHSEYCNPNIVYKPLIYLYPTKEETVTIKFLNEEKLTTTYPKYNGEWKVLAYPTGDLIDLNTNRKLYGLYWEGISNLNSSLNEGFVVKGEDTIIFLEEKLSKLGLNEREANEFIIFWLPILEKNKYNFIHFLTTDEVNEIMPIEVTPKVDNMIRVLMEYKPLEENINIKEQELTTPERKGFTLVEWGGTKLN